MRVFFSTMVAVTACTLGGGLRAQEIPPAPCSMVCMGAMDDGRKDRLDAGIVRVQSQTEEQLQAQMDAVKKAHQKELDRWTPAIRTNEAGQLLLESIPIEVPMGSAFAGYFLEKQKEKLEALQTESGIAILESGLNDLRTANPAAYDAAASGQPFSQWEEELFSTKTMAGLDPQHRTAVHAVREAALKDAVTRVAQGHVVLATDLEAAKEKLEQVDTGLTKLAEKTRDGMKALYEGQQAVASIATTALQQGALNAADIDDLQRQMWDTMSPAKRVAALENARFLRGITGEKRVAMKAELARVAKIQSFQETVGDATSGARAVLQIANALGVDVKGATHAVNVAEKALGLGIAIVAGGPLGMLTSAGALAGVFGGGSDAGQARHEEVMNALAALSESIQTMRKEMHELHAQTMNRLNELQAHLDTRFDEVLGYQQTTLDLVSMNQDLLIKLFQRETRHCNLVLEPRSEDMSVDEWFTANPPIIRSCREGLNGVVVSANGESDPSLTASAKSFSDTADASNAEARAYLSNVYYGTWQPTYNVTRGLNPFLSQQPGKPASRALFALLVDDHSTVQRNLSAWQRAQTAFSAYLDAPDGAGREAYGFYVPLNEAPSAKRALDGVSVLEWPIDTGYLTLIGNSAKTLAPLFERTRSDSVYGVPLTYAELTESQGRAVATAGRNEARRVFAHLIAHVDIARAQENMLAGAGLTVPSMEVLDALAAEPPDLNQWETARKADQSALDKQGPRCATAYHPYNLLCVLSRNHVANYNVGLSWTAHRLAVAKQSSCEPKASRSECRGYALDYARGNRGVLGGYLGLSAEASGRLTFVDATETSGPRWSLLVLPETYKLAGEGDTDSSPTIAIYDWDLVKVGRLASTSRYEQLTAQRVDLATYGALFDLEGADYCGDKVSAADCMVRSSLVDFASSAIAPRS